MNIVKLLNGMGNVFPEKLTMDFIRKMKCRDLTAEEQRKPYAKYFYREMAEIPPEDIAKVNAGPVDPTKVISVQSRNELMKPGYSEVETGYTLMPDGSGLAATLVKMPGVTPAMLDWWFNWHPLEGLRYALWCPVAHTGISVKNPTQHLDRSGVPMRERNYGSTHYPVEGFDVEGAQKVRIEFFSPEDYGLNMNMFKKPNISSAYLANCILHYINFPINTFFHAVREVKGGVEYRSRYWLGYRMRNGVPKKGLLPMPRKIVLDMARNNCIHSLIEYNNLASILPSLYKEMAGKIE
jgi:hypothetical protein